MRTGVKRVLEEISAVMVAASVVVTMIGGIMTANGKSDKPSVKKAARRAQTLMPILIFPSLFPNLTTVRK